MIQIQSDPIKYSLKKRDYWGIFPASRDAETGAVTPFGSPAKTCRCIKILSGSFLHHIIIISSLILQIWEQGWEWHALVEVRHEIQWSKEEKALGRWCYQYTGLSWAENMSSLHHHDWWHHMLYQPSSFRINFSSVEGEGFFGHQLIWERSASSSSQWPIW